MPRIAPLPAAQTPDAIQEAFQEHVRQYGGLITHMKATLGHSQLAFDVYMQWYPLYRRVQDILGNKLAPLFAYAVSSGSDCPLCSTFFRRILIDLGDHPEKLTLNTYESRLINFGTAIAKFKGRISNHVFQELAEFHNDREMVELIAFSGQMVATNIFNNVVETELDGYLAPYIPEKFI